LLITKTKLITKKTKCSLSCITIVSSVKKSVGANRNFGHIQSSTQHDGKV